MPAWLIVIGYRAALEWVLDNGRMAFRETVATDTIAQGDLFAIYATQRALADWKRVPQESRIVALGTIGSKVSADLRTVADMPLHKSCDLRIKYRLPLDEGILFRPLIPQLSFIKSKETWAGYLHRTLVPLPDRDFRVISTAVQTAMTDRRS